MSDQKEVPEPYVERTASERPGASASASAWGRCALVVGVAAGVELDGGADGVGVPDAVGVGDPVVGAGLDVPDGVGLGVSA